MAITVKMDRTEELLHFIFVPILQFSVLMNISTFWILCLLRNSALWVSTLRSNPRKLT
jgi:hypothetical protein